LRAAPQKKHKKVLVFNSNLCYSYIMRNSNLFKMTRTTYEQNPPSCGGNWECGEEVTVAISRSPKFACEMSHRRGLKGPDCIVSHSHSGEQGVPTISRYVLTRGTEVIFDRWD